MDLKIYFHIKKGQPIQEPTTLIYDDCPRPGSQITAINRTETKLLSGRSGFWKGQANYHRAFCRHQGPDFRKVVILRNGAVCTNQNLSNAYEFVVCWFPKHLRISWALYLAGIFVTFCRFRSCYENQTNPPEGQLLISKNQSEIV